MNQSKWTSTAIRSVLSNPRRDKNGTPCAICGKHNSITECHHLISVKTLTDLINDYGLPLESLRTPIVWLCPNCHAYFHKCGDLEDCLTKYIGIGSEMIKSGYGQNEMDALSELRRERDKWLATLRAEATARLSRKAYDYEINPENAETAYTRGCVRGE